MVLGIIVVCLDFFVALRRFKVSGASVVVMESCVGKFFFVYEFVEVSGLDCYCIYLFVDVIIVIIGGGIGVVVEFAFKFGFFVLFDSSGDCEF